MARAWGALALTGLLTVTFTPAHPPESPVLQPQVVTVHQEPAPVRGALAVKAALTRLGDPYVWAAAGPHSFDCSGLVVWAFEQAGISLPHSSQSLAAGGQPVSLGQMQPGDVIAFYSDASHVGIYVGNGKMVHASTEGVPVTVAPMGNAPIYNVRRYM